LTAIVVLDEPTPIFGGLVAAPVFAQIAEYGLRELRIPPPATATPTAAPECTPGAARPVGEADGTVPSTGVQRASTTTVARSPRSP
jgi:hypothetical protein